MKNSKRIKRPDRRKYHYIYETICLTSHRFYIGMHSTDNLQDGYCGSGKRLWNSINKYGKDKHVTKILEFLPDRKSLRKREKELINEELIGNRYCMNLALGGEGGLLHELTTEHQKAASKKGNEKIAWLRENDVEWAKKESLRRSRITKKLCEDGTLGYDSTGRKHKESTKQKIGKANSVQQRGKRNSQYGTCWICNPKLREVKKIKKEELSDYLEQGWVKGRKLNSF